MENVFQIIVFSEMLNEISAILDEEMHDLEQKV